MSVEMNLPEKTLPMKQDMENKENADSSTWDQVTFALEKGLAFPPSLNSSLKVKQTTGAINCSPDAITASAVPKVEPAETKNQHMSFSQTFLHKKSTKDRQLKTATQNSSVHLPERRVLGSYRGKIVSSKINSFRKAVENDGRKNSLAAPAKPVVKTDPTKDRVTNTVNASKPVSMPSLQTKPPVKVSVGQPKPILNQEKPSIKTTSVNKEATWKMPSKNWTPVLKTVSYNAPNSEQRLKKAVPPRNRIGALAGSVSETHGTKCVVTSKTVGNRQSTLHQSAEARRTQLAEWQASKGKVLKKPHAPLQTDARHTIEPQQTVKEPVESFWAAIAEEDEQQLFSDTVNKTLTECLCLIEKGCSTDKIHSTLEELILSVPEAKKLAKYWVCRMHLEQLGTLEKVMAVYEEAILAGAQPKDELRNALTDVLKDIKNIPKSDGECKKKETIPSCTVEANFNEEKVDVQPYNNKEASLTEECSKPEQESVVGNEEQSQTPAACKKEQNVTESQKNGVLEFKTPENNVGSYLIKYNVSTTPSLESMKKKLQCENSSSAVMDLKLLTPVRRSRRLQKKVCKLPEMLKDHNPCVSSLEQLGELGDEAVAFVYRPNSALHKVLEGQDNVTL
ncbi:cytoskeleton-associated protein 2 [Eublepharis macularius]|uniref:Cytoskeleton-associated protein 2 n=1 Tax=Eublepharis macularius TaxID=481883 RepID=A0AA97L3F4_EUBMA|nr:cytoskeleton-associated protein 2 [Eublepharis macularius]XP_054838577.1 cytoskeleton-associated protein 2 [Eublepharis macularius]XP_054838586.1 cytoskeleton-associated protein 2 [Eublepharis macularius]